MLKSILVTSLFLTQIAAHAQSLIKVDGSSTVFPITEGVTEEFLKTQDGKVNVTVGVSGTGGGFKKFCRGETDVQDASRPINKEEMETCRKEGIAYLELPIALDAIALVVNKKNNWVSEITVEELKKMWAPEATGTIMTWKQVNAKWPDQKLALFGASTDNGTFDYFTEAINGKAKASRTDYTPSVDHNTRVAGVNSNQYALGYMPLSYYASNKASLKLLAVVGAAAAGKKAVAVLPSEKTVLDGTYAPLSRPIFIYVSQKSMAKPEVKEYVNFYLKNADKITKQVQYVALPGSAYSKVSQIVEKNKAGTAFAGEGHAGLTLDQILKKEKSL